MKTGFAHQSATTRRVNLTHTVELPPLSTKLPGYAAPAGHGASWINHAWSLFWSIWCGTLRKSSCVIGAQRTAHLSRMVRLGAQMGKNEIEVNNIHVWLIRSRLCEKSLCWMLSHTSAEYSARGLCKHRDKYRKIVWEKAHKLLSNRFLSFSKAWVVQEERTESCGCSHQCLTHTAITGLPPSSTFLPVGVCFDSKFTHSPWCVDVSGKKNAS